MTVTTNIDAIFAIEPSGFIAGSQLAYELQKGFVPLRTPGKLPAQTIRLPTQDGSLEVHADAIVPGTRILLVGDCIGETMDRVTQALEGHGLTVVRHCAL